MSDTISEFLSSAKSAIGLGADATDTVSLVIGGVQITGWEEIEVDISIEEMPWRALLNITDYQPQNGTTAIIRAGQSASLAIDGITLITGYIETVERNVAPGQHIIALTVKSKSMDLIDCSAEFSTYQMNQTTALKIMQKVAAFAGIDIVSADGYGNTAVPQFSVILTETAYEIIERIARIAAVLFYDRPDGNIEVSRVGSLRMASGFTEGVNCEFFRNVDSQAGRYSSVAGITQATAVLAQVPDMDNIRGQMKALTYAPPVIDPGITRYRPLLILPENNDQDMKVSIHRLHWEVNRRYGRSQRVDVTCDSWRDTSGALWSVNRLAPVSLPSVGRQEDMLISAVKFRKGRDGQHADITLMSPAAFDIQPIVPPNANATIAAAQSSGSGPGAITQTGQ